MARLKDVVKGRNKRLISFVEEIERESAQGKQKDARVEFLQERIAEKEAIIDAQKERIKKMQEYQYVCHVLRMRMADLDPTIRNSLVAHDCKGKPLMPDFFDFSLDARKEWSDPNGRRY